MKSQSIYCRLDQVLQGKLQIHIIFLSVTFCIYHILEFRFSWQTWNNTCSWNPPGISQAALLSTRVILVITTMGLHPFYSGFLFSERFLLYFYLNGIEDEAGFSCIRNPPSILRGRLFPLFFSRYLLTKDSSFHTSLESSSDFKVAPSNKTASVLRISGGLKCPEGKLRWKFICFVLICRTKTAMKCEGFFPFPA